MKVIKDLAEMHDGTVQLISLVKAGATGAPFKRLKSEESEGDADVFKAENSKTIEGQPKLIALAVSKEGDVAAARAIAEASDLTIHDERETDGTTLLITSKGARVNTLDPEQIQVQLSDELIAVCQVEKSFIPFTGTTSFAEAIKAQGFYPQLSNALETFAGVAYQIMEGANSPSAAASDIQKAGDEFTNLVASMTKALPKETFKMAKKLKEDAETTDEETKTPEVDETTEGGESLAEKDTDGGAGDTGSAADETETEEVTETVEKDADATEEGEVEKNADATDAESTEEGGDEAATDEAATDEETETVETPSELSQVLKAIETLSATVAEQGETQAALKEQVEAVATKAEAAEAAVEDVAGAVKGRVLRQPAPDSRAKDEAAAPKSPPLADTGMANLRKR